MTTPLAVVTDARPANQLEQLHLLGQSVWYDNITRDLITDGTLQTLIADFGILGITSNPTIFAKAIATSTLYDRDIQEGIRAGQRAEEIFHHLALIDIRAAADLLRPMYDRTQAYDGYVSIEVSPTLADDTDGTIVEARQLWSTIDRPNLMVKVPATHAGLAAITALIADGININVTLIFALDRYRAVIDAYLGGLERRMLAGQPINRVASVASFFVSRVDTLVDQQLDERAAVANPAAATHLERLRGKAAVANAKLAYQLFTSIFSSERFAPYRERGAQVQRPLWASTGTKNPAYGDVVYVETLIGKDTVNTMPPATLTAFADHGQAQPTVTEGVAEARTLFTHLMDVGVDMAAMTHQLEVEGVRAFTASYHELLATIEGKRRRLETIG